jgi:hypothetical protein
MPQSRDDLPAKLDALLARMEKQDEANGDSPNPVDVPHLAAAAGEDPQKLADALWHLVRQGRAGARRVGRTRRVLATLVPGAFDAADFVALLAALPGADLYWLERFHAQTDGPGYHGWSPELDAMLQSLVDRGAASPLASAQLPEPVGSALLYSLARRGLVGADALPEGALERIAHAFAARASYVEDQFTGWERVWPLPLFAKAVWAAARSLEELGVWDSTLEPLVPFATPKQLVAAAGKVAWDDGARCIAWLAARGEDIRPLLVKKVDKAAATCRDDDDAWYVASKAGLVAGALARIDREAGRAWPKGRLPLARALLFDVVEGVVDVLRAFPDAVRERLLLDQVAVARRSPDPLDRERRLAPLCHFPSARLVEALHAAIQETRRKKSWDYERQPFFAALGDQGELGQAALRELLREPRNVEGALHGMTASPVNAVAAIPFVSNRDALALWQKLPDADLLRLVEAHFDALPPAVIADLLTPRHHLAEVVPLAERLPASAEPQRSWLLTRPEPLDRYEQAARAATPEAMARAEAAWKAAQAAADPEAAATALERDVPLDDLGALLRITAGNIHSFADARILARAFASAPGMAWVAVFWWLDAELRELDTFEQALGAALAPPVRARLDARMVDEKAVWRALRYLMSHDAAGSVRFFTERAGVPDLRPHVVDGLVLACAAGSREASAWVEAELRGKTPEVALRVAADQPLPGWKAALDPLAKKKGRLQALAETALAKLVAMGPPHPRGTKRLEARRLGKLPGPIWKTLASADGRVVGAGGAGEVVLWKGDKETKLEGLGAVGCALSPDGAWLLVQEEFSVQVYAPWKRWALRATLKPHDGLFDTVPAPGDRAFTLCAANNAYTPLTLWRLASGKEEVHRLDGMPAAVAVVDDERYLVGTMNGEVILRALAKGKVLARLLSASEAGAEDADGTAADVAALAVGDHATLAASLDEAGTLRFWSLAPKKPKLVAVHHRAAHRGLVMDPASSFSATASPTNVQIWSGALPMRPLEGPGELAAEPWWDDWAPAGFVREGVLAVGGEGVDVWDAAKGVHLGRWEGAVTSLAVSGGRLVVGDAEGGVWDVRVPSR